MKGAWNNRKGTTLVEILVVMLILLVGIMTVIQMFIPGFRVVRAAESQTIATKLAQAEVERWKNMPGNLPDGILPIGSDGLVLNRQYPGPPFEGFTLPTGATVYEAGNALNCRYVENEPVGRIAPGTYFVSGDFLGSGVERVYGSRYVLGFCPIERDVNVLAVKSGDLQRRVGESDSPIYLRSGQYGVDYNLDTTGSEAAFYVSLNDTNPNHVYYVSYSYYIGKSTGEWTLISAKDQQVYPTDENWVRVPISVPASYSGYDVTEVEENSDSCARGFVAVTPVPEQPNAWSDDPYEFSLVDPILGIILLNPAAANATEYTARGVRPITARIGYRIYDPRIIREDRVMPAPNEDPLGSGANTHSAIKLALRFILNAGTPGSIVDGDPTDNPDEPTFEGLVKSQLGLVITDENAGDIVVKQSVLIMDLATGLRVEIPPNAPPFYAIDYKAGVVHLPKEANLIGWNSEVPDNHPELENVKLEGRHLRFFYRADGDWSVQCQKAYSYYMRNWDTSGVDYSHFKLLPATSTDPYRLLFALCDSGKNVTVDYSYTTLDGVQQNVVGRTLRISDDWVVDPDQPGSQCAYITIDIPNGAVIDPSSRIVVTGASFRTRVVWRDGKHWRFVDIDTNLTRNSLP